MSNGTSRNGGGPSLSPSASESVSIGGGFSGNDNVFIGRRAGRSYHGGLGWPPVDDAPADFWTCAYCGQSNAAEREGCRSCQAPRTERGES